MTANVMFDRATIEAEIVQLQALVDSIKERRGTAAKKLQDATLTALDMSVSFNDSDTDAFTDKYIEAVDGIGDGKSAVKLSDLAEYVQALNEWAEQLAHEAVTSILKANGQADNTAALKEQYDAKRTMIEAMVTLCVAQKIDVSGIVIPHLRAGRPPGTTTRKPGSKWAHFYRIVDGVRKDQSDSQNTLSSFAFYHGAKMTGSDERVSTADLTAFLKTQGVDSPMGKPWSIEVDGVTYGMDVESEATADTASEEE